MSRGREEKSKGIFVGNAIHCINALSDPEGCGFSTQCKSCMVRKTVLDTFQTGQNCQSVEANIPFGAENGILTLHVLVSTTLLKFPQENKMILCLDDITLRKKAETKLKKTKKDLEHFVCPSPESFCQRILS